MRTRIELLVLLAAAGVCLGVARASVEEEVARQDAVLRSLESTEKERRVALARLEQLAASPVGEPGMREAVFALALYGQDRPVVEDDRGLRALAAATSLFPDDPRTPALLAAHAARSLEAGDPFGAHLSFLRLLEGTADVPRPIGPAQLVRAARNAASVGDARHAMEWAFAVDPQALEDEADRLRLRVTKLIAGQALGRAETALTSARELADGDRDALVLDPQALLAAARAFEDSGFLDRAIELRVALVNVHPASAERDRALLDLARLHERKGERGLAARYLSWLAEDHDDFAAGFTARLRLLEIDGEPARVEQTAPYLDLIRASRDAAQARESCARFVERFTAAGHALELMAALGHLASEREHELARLAALEAFGDALAPIVVLLASREDDVAIAAVSAIAEELQVAIPAEQAGRVASARRALGLPGTLSTAVERAIEEARRELSAGEAERAERLLDLALRSMGSSPAALEEAVRLRATALWRSGRDAEALEAIERWLGSEAEPQASREMRVLHADVLFGTGAHDRACAAYDEAAALAPSPWVTLQQERCRRSRPAEPTS